MNIILGTLVVPHQKEVENHSEGNSNEPPHVDNSLMNNFCLSTTIGQVISDCLGHSILQSCGIFPIYLSGGTTGGGLGYYCASEI